MPVLNEAQFDMTVKELAALLSISERSAYRLLDEGKVNHRRPCRSIQVDRVDAQRYLHEITIGATHPERRMALV